MDGAVVFGEGENVVEALLYGLIGRIDAWIEEHCVDDEP